MKPILIIGLCFALMSCGPSASQLTATSPAPLTQIPTSAVPSVLPPTAIPTPTALESLVIDNAVVVPSDVTKISYPAFYQTVQPTTATVADPYCATTTEQVAYPADYLGAFQMPKIGGAPLSSAIRRGVALKDYWMYGRMNPSTNKDCTGDIHTAFLDTLQRFKRLGVDHIDVMQNADVVDINASPMQIKASVTVNEAVIPDSELEWVVQQAQANGLKVHEYMQIDMIDGNQVALPTSPSEAWISNFLDAYNHFIVDQAIVAEKLKIEAFQLDWGVYFIDWTPYKSIFISKMTSASRQVRNVYSGKIIFGTAALWMAGDPALVDLYDWFTADLAPMGSLSDAENADITVPLMKQKYLDFIHALGTVWGSHKKPVVWRISAQSHRNYLQTGWVEDGFCVDELIRDQPGNFCRQRNAQTDFSVQAIAYEAMLEAIATQTVFTTESVDTFSYWFVDVILPKDSFPNISQSPRNKPAESILLQWFAKP